MTEEESSVLNKLLSAVQNYKSNEQTNSNAGGWIAGVVALVLALVGVVILAYQQWKAGKERAKLLHEKALREEEAHQAEVDANLEADRQKKFEALDRVTAIHLDVDRLAQEIKRLQVERDDSRAKIDQITSWEDVDAFTR